MMMLILILINTKNFNGETKNLNYDNVKTVKSSKEATKTYQDFQKKTSWRNFR
mgnify:CR=1 FL=1